MSEFNRRRLASIGRVAYASAAIARGKDLGYLIFSVGIALAGCRSAPSLTPQQADGKHLYDVRCAHCHEENDLALKKVPPNLHGLFMHKTLPSGIPLTDDAVRHNVLAGRGIMPGFAGRFDDGQMAALLAYLHIY